MKDSFFIYLLLLTLSLFGQNTQELEFNSIKLNYIGKELSKQWVSSIIQDNDGFIWLGTQDGLYRYDGNNFISYRYNPLKKESLPANWVRDIAQDTDGTFWIGTQGVGLVKFNAQKEIFQKYRLDSKNETTFKGLSVYSLFITSVGVIWVETDNGLYRKAKNDIDFVKLSNVFLGAKVSETKDGKEIVVFNKTLYEYDKSKNKLNPLLENTPIERLSISSKNNLIFRSEGKLYSYNFKNNPIPIKTPNHIKYMSNIHNDICVLVAENKLYKFDINSGHIVELRVNNPDLNISEINVLFLDAQGVLWIAGNNGLLKENIAGKIFKENIPLNARRIIVDDHTIYLAGANGLHIYSLASKTHKTILDKKNITSIYKSADGLWAGDTFGIVYFIDNKFKITSFPLVDNNDKLLKIFGIVEDKNGYIWISSWGGIHLLNKKGEIIKNFNLNSSSEIDELKAIQIHIDKDDNLWVITAGNGVYKIPNITSISSNKTKFNYKQYLHKTGDKSTLNSNVLYELHEDKTGNIWIGSDYGINKYNSKTNTFEGLEIDGELFDKKTMAIETDNNGLLWISTIRNGIYVYNPNKKELLNFNQNDGLISDACLFTSSVFFNNILYFGTDQGVQIINPDYFTLPIIDKGPIITDLKIYGESEENLLNPLLNNQKVVLKHHQTDFTIHFSLPDYRFPEKINYYYKLNATSNTWRKAENNTASFTNLKQGDYQFLVKAAYQSNTDTPISIFNIEVTPPWYKTWWAYLSLAAFFSSLFYLYYSLRLKQQITTTKLKGRKELDKAKSIFFANISHEFRTPLTLISGPIERQLSKPGISKADKEEFNLILRNAKRLLNLVNQLLDLSKLESKKLKLNISKGNLSHFLEELVSAFKHKALDKNIKFSYKIKPITSAWFDKDIVEKIVTNLLSNAIKYTPKNGRIHISANTKESQVIIKVTNNGNILTNDDMTNLFKRFYQANKTSEGVGIGLALVKELTNIYHGSISVQRIHKDDIQFIVMFPFEKEYFDTSEIYDVEPVLNDDYTGESINLMQSKPNSKGDLPLMLIVEDDADIRHFIKSIFKNDYKIFESKNGQEGIEKAFKTIPDIIISDVMMPLKNGFELCNILKEDEKTSHIPIILLTAKTGEENEIDGLNTGADDYITKPFSAKKLVVRVEKLIELRKKLRNRYQQNLIQLPKDIAITSTDEKFLNRIEILFETHLTNPSFNAESFSKTIGMSRMQLHRKLIAITGHSTTAFIRSQRLKIAMQHLKTSDATISEVAYTSGFNTVSYFIKCFKEIYGKTPSEYHSN
ncbi:MAG TPA: two-component regulator propeller domain-containing protein [Lutibacter sp.]